MLTFREACHPTIGQEEIDAVTKVLQNGVLSDFKAGGEQYYGGEKVKEFERLFAEKFGVKYAIAFNSATAALHAACVACGVDFGDEVIVSPYTFTASASCVLMASGDPVFADIDPETFCITGIEGYVTPETKAIIPVHLFGHPADMEEILDVAEKYNLKIIEDSAQAIGAEYYGRLTGTIGDCGIFSFQETKTISTGEGGMLITDNDEIWDKACAVRNHGEVKGHNFHGYNYRMTEIEAAIGIVQLSKLDEFNRQRIELCSHLTQRLSEIKGIYPPVVRPDCKHVYYVYAVLVPHRDLLVDELAKRGIWFGKGYVEPLYHLNAYGGGNRHEAERVQKVLMTTPICRPPATLEDMDMIADAIKEILWNL
jgi:perosamine synthetase